MDSTRRSIVGSTGAVFLVGGITILTALGHLGAWRTVLGWVMVVVGAVSLMTGLWRPSPKRDLLQYLDQKRSDGQMLLAYQGSDLEFLWRGWAVDILMALRRTLGESSRELFTTPNQSEPVLDQLNRNLGQLDGIRQHLQGALVFRSSRHVAG